MQQVKGGTYPSAGSQTRILYHYWRTRCVSLWRTSQMKVCDTHQSRAIFQLYRECRKSLKWVPPLWHRGHCLSVLYRELSWDKQRGWQLVLTQDSLSPVQSYNGFVFGRQRSTTHTTSCSGQPVACASSDFYAWMRLRSLQQGSTTQGDT